MGIKASVSFGKGLRFWVGALGAFSLTEDTEIFKLAGLWGLGLGCQPKA